MSRTAPVTLDAAWLAANPLPSLDEATDKNSRGRVLVAGGAAHVPGAIRLTGEAALRAGAGKLQMATLEDAAMVLGMAVPEAAVIALPIDRHGELAKRAVPLLRKALDRCDTFIIGPGMGDSDKAAVIVEALLDSPRDGLSVVIDAAAIACASRLNEMLCRHAGRLVLTPHHGEMAALT
ncbi:MAG: ADP/ATP-dependent (S)-NAD(P)H-hydrate dehydratase, partial [Sphingomonas sp.]